MELLHVVSPVCVIAGPYWKANGFCSKASATSESFKGLSPVKSSHFFASTFLIDSLGPSRPLYLLPFGTDVD
jgi:hypothetical protein